MAQPIRPYYAEKGLSTVFYDQVTAADRSLDGDIDIYAALAPAGGSFLELGAGSGRVAFPLAERGFTVVGVDLSPAMLAQAQARLARVPPEVADRLSFRRADMTSLALERTFDAVICTFFSLAHLPAGAAWTNAFKVMARHLAPGGKAAVHLPDGAVISSLPPVDPKLPVMRTPVDGGGTLQLYVAERSFRANVGRFDQVLDYVLCDSRGAVVQRSRERQTYYVADPLPFAERAGLVPDGAPIDLGGVGAVHLFRKT